MYALDTAAPGLAMGDDAGLLAPILGEGRGDVAGGTASPISAVFNLSNTSEKVGGKHYLTRPPSTPVE